MKTIQMTGCGSTEQVNQRSSVDCAIGSPRATALALLTCMLWITLPGCAPEGKYVGGIIEPAAEKVLLFDIDGPAGKSFVKMLGTGFTKMGLTVQYASDLDPLLGQKEGPDNTIAADLARQAGAQAFIRGETTKSEVMSVTKYVVRGHFELYATKGAVHVGGVPDAKCIHDVDPFIVGKGGIILPFEILRKIGDPKGKSYYDTLATEEQKHAESVGPEVQQKLADHVAKQLAIGLGKNRRP